MAPVTPSSIAVSAGTGATNLLTPDPKEVYQRGASSATTFQVDFGSVVSINQVLLGYTNAPAGAAINIQSGVSSPTETLRVSGHQSAHSVRSNPRRHWLWTSPNAFNARYLQITGPVMNLEAGVIAAGLAFRPTWGHEYGGGRFYIDTGTRERLLGGGFGINEGVVAPGWAFTLGDLTDDEILSVESVILGLGETRTALVCEDTDAGNGMNERIHWGMLSRIEQFERIAPQLNKWAFRIEDWV